MMQNRLRKMNSAEEFEKKHVHDVYKEIASHFDKSRFSVWGRVKKFINDIPKNSKIADIGCGNGKNMKMRPTEFVGCDFNNEFVKICKEQKLNVVNGSVLKIPFDDCSIDYTICIAVIHHLSTEERRIDAIKELIRITKPKGQIMIQVWAMEQEKGSKFVFTEQDTFVPWNNDKERYYHVFKKGELESLVDKCSKVKIIESFFECGNWGVILECDQ